MSHTNLQFRGVPSFFRAHCVEASQGGARTYRDAGWHLAIHLREQTPLDDDDPDWDREIAVLTGLLDRKDRAGALAWFVDHYPRCMALVPVRRREQFLNGVLQAHEDGRLAE